MFDQFQDPRVEEAREKKSRRLDLSHGYMMESLDCLEGLEQLEHLILLEQDLLEDLSGLAQLPNLKSLDISKCYSLKHLRAEWFDGLTNLTKLSARTCRSLEDISGLSSLSSLKSLDLEDNVVRDYSPLCGLVDLEICFLGGSDTGAPGLKDLDFLSGWKSMEHLVLRWCPALENIEGLSGLKALKVLSMTGCRSLRDISSLSELESLTQLELVGKLIEDISALSSLFSLESLILRAGSNIDLSQLSGLTALKTLKIEDHDARDLGALAPLEKLEVLEVKDFPNLHDVYALRGTEKLGDLTFERCEALTDLTVLSDLRELWRIELTGCTSITDLRPLSKLQKMKRLLLGNCSSLRDIRPIYPLVSNLTDLLAYGTQIDHLPAEFLERTKNRNLAPAIKAHLQSIEEQGGETWNQCKVIVLGNGRVGKTSLVKALRGDDFDPAEESTHGIRLWEHEISVQEDGELEPESVNLQIWDFGGQDLYHNTHRLFMRCRAIFVIVWSAQEFWDGEQEREPRRPLQYWLDQIYSLHSHPEIVIIRNKADLKHDAQRHLDLDWKHQVEARHHNLLSFDFSAETWAESGGDRFSRHRDLIRHWLGQSAFKVLGNRDKRTIGRGRLRVIESLQESNAKLILWPDFLSLIHQHMPGTEDSKDPWGVLDFLHDSGVVFHDDYLLRDQIIVDQRWALDGIYSIFDRKLCWDNLVGREGRFFPSQLGEWVWDRKGYSKKVQELFLGFMNSCGVATPLLKSTETRKKEAYYLAPQYLPPRETLQGRLDRRLQEWGEPTLEFPLLENRFLGVDTILGLIIRVTQTFSRDAILWKYGAFFEARGRHRSAAFLEWVQDDPVSYGGKLFVRLYGEMDLMKNALVREFHRLEVEVPGGLGPEKLTSSEEITGLGQMTERHEVVRQRLAFSVSGLDPKCPRVKACSDALHEEAKRWFPNYEIVHYAEEQNLNTIPALMDTIGKSDIVVAIIGRRYLESPYCMEEMRIAYRNFCDVEVQTEDDGHLLIYRHPGGELLEKPRLLGNRHRQFTEARWNAYWQKGCLRFMAQFGRGESIDSERVQRQPLWPWYRSIGVGILGELADFWRNWRCLPLPLEGDEKVWARQQMEAIRRRVDSM